MELMQDGGPVDFIGFPSYEEEQLSSDEKEYGNSAQTISTTIDFFDFNYSRVLSRTSITINSDTETSRKEEEYKLKERELEMLVGKKEFKSLDKETKDLLINVVGVLEFDVPIDIKKTLEYSIYDE